MRKSVFQFYATHNEIQRFINEVVSGSHVHVYLLRFSPEYAMQELMPDEPYRLDQWSMAVYSEFCRDISTHEAYIAYSKTDHGDLNLYIGEESETELRESFIGTAGEHSINPVWTKLIRKLKKSCRKGAYVVTLQNIRQYYPHVVYSEGAKEAWRKGKILRPAAGWNHIDCISE